MQKCIQCDMFEFCFRDEIEFKGHIENQNKTEIVKKIDVLTKPKCPACGNHNTYYSKHDFVEGGCKDYGWQI